MIDPVESAWAAYRIAQEDHARLYEQFVALVKDDARVEEALALIPLLEGSERMLKARSAELDVARARSKPKG